jgi:hypothetical protein
LDNLSGVAREVPYRGVDLAKGDLHSNSVEGRGVEGRERTVFYRNSVASSRKNSAGVPIRKEVRRATVFVKCFVL